MTLSTRRSGFSVVRGANDVATRHPLFKTRVSGSSAPAFGVASVTPTYFHSKSKKWPQQVSFAAAFDSTPPLCYYAPARQHYKRRRIGNARVILWMVSLARFRF